MELDEAFGLVGEFGPRQRRLTAFLVLLQVGVGRTTRPLPFPLSPWPARSPRPPPGFLVASLVRC